MRCYKTKPVGFGLPIESSRVTVILLSPEESRRAYEHLCEGIQKAAREARERAPNSKGLVYCLRLTE